MTTPAREPSTPDPFAAPVHAAMASAAALSAKTSATPRAKCTNCGRFYPRAEDAVACAYSHSHGGVPADAPQNVEHNPAYTPQEELGLRQPPPERLTDTERRWLMVLEDNPHYCTDDATDRIALARVLAAVPTPLTVSEWDGIIAQSIHGFVAAQASGGWQPNIHSIGMQRQIAQHLAGNLWAALQQRGILP